MNPQEANPKKVATFGAIFLAISLTMLSIAGFLVWKTCHFLDRAVRAQGTITALVRVTGPIRHRKPTYAAQFSFTTPAKQAVTITSTSSSNPPEFEVGESVVVLYLPNNPADARIDSFFQLWGASSIVGGIGTVFLAFSLGMILYLRKLAGGPGLDDSSDPDEGANGPSRGR